MILREYLAGARLWRDRVRQEASGPRRFLWLYVYSPVEVGVVAGMLAACWIMERLGCE